MMSPPEPFKHNLSYYMVWSRENQLTFWPATFFSLQTDDVWIIFISCSRTWDKPSSQLHRFKAVAWLKTIACLWIFLFVTENIYFIMVVHTFCGSIWVRKDLTESCSLTACFIKVEILLILLENPDLFRMWKFTMWKLNNLLTFLWWRKAPAPASGCVTQHNPDCCSWISVRSHFTFILALKIPFCYAPGGSPA